MNRGSVATRTGIAIVAAFFGWFVWPTPYHYDHMVVGSRAGNDTLLVRVNRFSGETQVLYPSGWVTPQPAVYRPPESLSNDDLAKLVAERAEFVTAFGEDEIRADIYNGTDSTVSSITIELTLKNLDGSTVFVREYQLSTLLPFAGKPKSSSTYEGETGFHPVDGQTFSWRILKAEVQ